MTPHHCQSYPCSVCHPERFGKEPTCVGGVPLEMKADLRRIAEALERIAAALEESHERGH